MDPYATPAFLDSSYNEPSFATVPPPMGHLSSETLIQNLQRIREEDVRTSDPPSETTMTALSLVKEIGYELYQGLEPTKEVTRDETYQERATQIQDTLMHLRRVQVRFQEQLQRVQVSETNVKESLERTHKSLQEIQEFTYFLEKLTDRGTETAAIKTLIVDLAQTIRDTDSSQSLKETYEKELDLLQLYVQGFMKEVNGLNIGNTCALCLQRPVTKYMNPCGHTGCDECLATLQEDSGTRSRCFMCRTPVMKLQKLYFC